MLEPEEILAALIAWAQPKLLAGKRVLLTAGPTFEAIDPVRGITNASSGKMGYALAQACAEAGAKVTLVSGPTAAARRPRASRRIDVTSAADMASAVDARSRASRHLHRGRRGRGLHACDRRRNRRSRRPPQPLTLALKPTVDILAAVAARRKPPFCVGFAAETDDVGANAEAKRRKKKLPLLIANRAQDAFGQDENEVDASRRARRASVAANDEAAAFVDLRQLNEADGILHAADHPALHGIPARASLSILRARIHVANGRLPAAVAAGQAALASAETLGADGYASTAHCVLAVIALRGGDIAAAAQHIAGPPPRYRISPACTRAPRPP